jgi:multidrug resistance efflux pump
MTARRFPCGLILIVVVTLAALARGADSPATAPTTQAISVPATIEPFWAADLSAKVSGYVNEVKADLGDHVSKGQLLAVIAEPELEAALAAAKATLAAKRQMLAAADAAVAQAKQSLAVAQQQLESYKAESQFQDVTLKRQEELSAGNAATPQALDEARSKSNVARASVGIGQAKVASAEADIAAAHASRDVAAAQIDVADAQVRQAQVMLDYTKIVAPFDGVITNRVINPGDLVQVGGSARPLFTIQQIDTVRILCDVPESAAVGVSAGGRAEVKLFGSAGRTVTAAVTRFATSLNPQTRTMRAEIDLKNPGEALRPGMYAQVTITLQPPPPPAPPARAEQAASQK